MTGPAPGQLAVPWRRSLASPGTTILVAALVVLPGVALNLLGWRYAASLEGLLPVDLTNGLALRRVVSTFFSPSSHADSWIPMQRALQAVNGPARDALYETLFFRDNVRFQYPPTSLLSLDALDVLGLSSVRALNALNSLVLALNAAALGALGYVLFRARPAGFRGPWPDPGIMTGLAAASAFLFYPIIRAHVLGQIQLWIDLLFTLSVLMWLLDRRLLAGVLVGLACSIKPQLGLVVIWALLWRQHRFVAGSLLALTPIAAASLARYGLHNHLEYLQVLSFLSRHGESFFANNSINGILNGYLSPDNPLRWSEAAFTPFHPAVYAGTLAASAVFYGGALVMAARRSGRPPRVAEFGAAAICTVVGSPVAWEHHYGLLAPLFLIALHAGLTARGGRRRRLLIGLTFTGWVLVANFIPFASLLAGGPLSIVQAYGFFGALLLLAALLMAPRDPVAG